MLSRDVQNENVFEVFHFDQNDKHLVGETFLRCLEIWCLEISFTQNIFLKISHVNIFIVSWLLKYKFQCRRNVCRLENAATKGAESAMGAMVSKHALFKHTSYSFQCFLFCWPKCPTLEIPQTSGMHNLLTRDCSALYSVSGGSFRCICRNELV